MSIPNPMVDSRFCAVTPIRYAGGEGHATGFYYIDENGTYLVTNKHVLSCRSINGNPVHSVRIYIRPQKGNTATTESRDIQVNSQDGEKYWYAHPGDDEIDIAVVPLEPPVVETPIEAVRFRGTRESETFAFDQEHLPRNDEVIVGGTSLTILGYPFRVTAPYFPVARDALCATPYGFPFEGKPRFMTDAKTHPGLSGSPILTQPSPMQADVEGGFNIGSPRKAWYLVGVHSADLSTDIQKPLDLNEAWYSTLIPDIINTI